MLTRARQFLLDHDSSVLARGTLGNLLIRVVGAGTTFVTEVVVARVIGAESYGAYVYALGLIAMAGVVSKFGFDVTAMRFVAAYHLQGQFSLVRGFLRFSRKWVFTASVAVTCLLIAGLLVARNRISEEFQATILIGGPLLILLSLSQLEQGVLYGLRKTVYAELPLNVVRPLIVMLLAWGFSWSATKPAAPTALFWTLLATTGALAMSYLFVRRASMSDATAGGGPEERRYWLHTSRTLVLVAAAGIILSRTDVVMLGALVTSAEVGQYGAALRLSTLLIFFLLAVNSALGPLIAGLHARKEHHKLQRVVSLASTSIFVASSLAAIVLVAFGKYLLQLFGPQFPVAYPVLIVMLVGQIINALAGPVALLLNMTGHQHDVAKVLALSATMNVVLNAVLIPRYGALGAAIAMSFSMASWNVIMSVIVWKRLELVALAVPLFWRGKAGA